uniref:Uncharacterized protein n=1 Tax=Paramormyrops kingsleyae TaxID=1676925 RepID=A0A3B3QC27_9TELE
MERSALEQKLVRFRQSHPDLKCLWAFRHFIYYTVKRLAPVLMIFWMTLATCPFRRELSSLTNRIKQVQRTAREVASRIRPTHRSDMEQSANRCLPEGTRSQINLTVHPAWKATLELISICSTNGLEYFLKGI